MMNSLEADGGDDDSRPSEDHNTKKVRFNDGFDVVAVDMVVDIDPSSSMAMLWKDKLLDVGLAGSVKELMESDRGSGGDHILFEENGYYLENFQIIEDYEKVLTQGPWIIYRQYLTVQLWTKDFSPLQPYPSVVMAWIKLPGYRGLCKAAKFDFKNDNRIKGRFAKMAVFINLDRPLVSWVLVNGEIQRVEYKALSTIYFYCGNTKTTVDGEPREAKDKTRRMFKTAYRTWILVEQRSFEARVVYEVTGSGGLIDGESEIGEEIMEGTTIQNEESDRITKETRAKDNINDFLGAQTRSGKDLDMSLEAQLSSGNDDALHAGEGIVQQGVRTLIPVRLWLRGLLVIQVMGRRKRTIAVGLEQPMQIHNFDGVKAHFNPTFEGLEDVDVQLIKSILDPGKHSVVIFIEIPNLNSHEHSKG
ncbi:hypothetical protein GOBAR_DD04303 [Gossypium barbadense]|nr:hypothetical protein GOBAR_DD04303 [Gossypium barbadense]